LENFPAELAKDIKKKISRIPQIFFPRQLFCGFSVNDFPIIKN
jgi:hypothetical protein